MSRRKTFTVLTFWSLFELTPFQERRYLTTAHFVPRWKLGSSVCGSIQSTRPDTSTIAKEDCSSARDTWKLKLEHALRKEHSKDGEIRKHTETTCFFLQALILTQYHCFNEYDHNPVLDRDAPNYHIVNLTKPTTFTDSKVTPERLINLAKIALTPPIKLYIRSGNGNLQAAMRSIRSIVSGTQLSGGASLIRGLGAPLFFSLSEVDV